MPLVAALYLLCLLVALVIGLVRRSNPSSSQWAVQQFLPDRKVSFVLVVALIACYLRFVGSFGSLLILLFQLAYYLLLVLFIYGAYKLGCYLHDKAAKRLKKRKS